MTEFNEAEAREAAEIFAAAPRSMPINDNEATVIHAYESGYRAAWTKAQEDIDRLQKLADSQIAYATRLEAKLKIATEALEKILGEKEYSISREPWKLIADEALAKIRGEHE
jgi:hypothetical protein